LTPKARRQILQSKILPARACDPLFYSILRELAILRDPARFLSELAQSCDPLLDSAPSFISLGAIDRGKFKDYFV